MDLRRRLAQYDTLSRKQRPAGSDPAIAAVTRAPADETAAAPPWAAALGLCRRSTALGEVWTAEGKEPSPSGIDRGQLGSLGLVLAGPPPSKLEPDELLLLDTETTGLAGGTGTLAFLVGCAWWEGEAWRWRQYFLPAPGCETPLLSDLAALAARFRVVVTFNGAVFDLPLLRTRALLSRIPDPVGMLANWDLLPVCRRLWGRRLPDCRQQTVEAHAAGRPRATEEIDGALIPHVYFQFLRSGEPGLLPAVLSRNRRDLEGMAAILTAAVRRTTLIERYDQAPSAAAAKMHWADAWSAGRLCERARRHAAAAAWLRGALAGRRTEAVPPPVYDPLTPSQALEGDRGARSTLRAARLGSPTSRLRRPADSRPAPAELFYRDAIRLLKRVRDWPAVEGVLRTALVACGDQPWLHREAAILYEHRLRRPDLAWPHAERLGEVERLARLRGRLLEVEPADPASQ